MAAPRAPGLARQGARAWVQPPAPPPGRLGAEALRPPPREAGPLAATAIHAAAATFVATASVASISVAAPSRGDAAVIAPEPDMAPPAPIAAAAVRLHVPGGADGAEIGPLFTRLVALGLPAPELVPTLFGAARAEVRHFHAADAAAAEAIAMAIGAVARDFISYAPAPPEGLIDIRLGG
jgi:hypothetical protein